MKPKKLEAIGVIAAFISITLYGLYIRVSGLSYRVFYIDEIIQYESSAGTLSQLFNHIINLDIHPPGFYLLRISDFSTGQTYSKKILIQR